MPDRALFNFYPSFFNEAEQLVLLKASLKKLDAMDSHRARKKRRAFIGSHFPKAEVHAAEPITSLFLPDEFYEFIQVNPLCPHMEAVHSIGIARGITMA